MDEYEEYEEEGTSRRPLLIIIIILLVLAAVGGVTAFFLTRNNGGNTEEDRNLAIGYATEAKVFLDEKSLGEAMSEAAKNAREKTIALQYQNDAYSTDGETFTCRLINSENNKYDMFLLIYADPEWTDELLRTGLVPPGSGFEELTLNRALEPGDHTVYVVYTQVETDEDGHQTIRNQTAHTVEFHVR